MNSKHIAVVLYKDPNAAEQLAGQLNSETIDVRITRTTDEFHEVLNKQRVDLLVVENELHGFLSGLEILERTYDDLLRPRTILVGDLPREAQARAKKVGVDRIVSGSDSVPQIREAAEALLHNDTTVQTAIPHAARAILRRTPDLKPLPQVMTKLCNYLDHQTASMTALAEDIAVDPKITAELLKLTNSPAFGFRTKVKTVFDAVRLLGIRRTVGLVLSANMVRSQADLANSLPPDVQNWYNSRSVLIGSTASAFARNVANVSADTAYVLGLLQDIGVLVLAQFHGVRYLKLLERVRKLAPLRLEICEMQEFEIHHAHVSAAVMQKWQLPQSLISMVLAHHDGSAGEPRPEIEERFLHVMRIGEAVANLTDVVAPQRYQPFGMLLAPYGGVTPAVSQCLAEAVAKTAESSALFSLPAPDAETMSRLFREVGPQLKNATQTPAAESPAISSREEKISSIAATSKPAQSPENSDATDPSGIPKQVLVVENDSQVLQSIELMLSEFDIAILSASNGEEARIHAPRADLVICGVHLEEKKNGVRVARNLREQRFDRPIIMMSEDRCRSTVMECLNAGANEYLVKPFDKSTLIGKLRKLGLSLEPRTTPVAI